AAPECVVNAKITVGAQVVPEAQNVQLNGTPSKGDVYLWEQLGGPPVSLSSTSAPRPTFTAPDVGPDGATLTFRLTVTGCNPVQQDSTTTNISVTNVLHNQPPVASAIAAPVVANEGDTVTLDGSASSDPDGDLLTYEWTQTTGPTVSLTNAGTKTATFVAPDIAYPDGVSLTFRLKVSDGALDSTTDKTVTIKWVNDPPVAQLTCSEFVDEGQTATLDGTTSTDADNGIVAWDWNQLLGPPDAGISALATPFVTFVAPKLGYQETGELPFRLTATDAGGLKSSAECTVWVNDVTPPSITGAADKTVEATSVAGALVTYAVSAYDAVDGDVAAPCSPASGSTFTLGNTTVACSAKDAAGNQANGTFTVSVVDTTPPSIASHASMTAEATGPNGTAVAYTAPNATDLVDGVFPANCLPSSGSIFALGATTVSCSATDKAGNSASSSFQVSVVDTTPPSITKHDDVAVVATGNSVAVVTYLLPTASDLVDGSVAVDCKPASGSTFPVGSTSVSCSAKDAHGNASQSAFNVVVSYNWNGFFKPVDNLPVLNVAKAGSAVPIKFSLGGYQGLAIFASGYPTAANVGCDGSAVQDLVDETVTAGSSSLTYDATAGQYVYVWKTDKLWAGSCRQFSVKLADGSVRSAQFKLTK
ncbi:MAG: PxKF domain-containing protein, partial [Vicinamibacterales bacterium]